VQATDLVADLENDTSIHQTLQADGITDEIWSNLVQNLKNIEGSLSVQDGKLTAQMKISGQDQPRTFVLAPSATGMPQTLSDLLQRGNFEQLAELFIQNGGAKLYLLPGAQQDLELANVVLVGSILSVQSMAAHSRGLQDAGLAKYAGSDVVIVLANIAIVALVIGIYLAAKYCKHNPTGNACEEGQALIAIATLALLVLLIRGPDILHPNSDSGGCDGPLTYVMEWHPDTGWESGWVCGPPPPPGGL
jgi:hypothetical protein